MRSIPIPRSSSRPGFAALVAAALATLAVPAAAQTNAPIQLSHVGTRVRSDLYRQLFDSLGTDAFALRTISGDVTSNGTVAEAGYVDADAWADEEIPLVVAKGDHDTDTTFEQLEDDDVITPDLDLSEVSGLQPADGRCQRPDLTIHFT